MAKEKEAPAENQEAPKKKGKGKLLIIIIAVVILAVAGVAVKMFLFNGTKKQTTPNQHKSEVTHEQAQEEEPVEPAESTVVSQSHLTPVVIGPIIVNLADVGGDRYLKIKLVLLEAKRAAKKEEKEGEKTGISLEDAVVKDTIISVLSAKTSDDLLSASGKEELKNELISAINQALHMNLVKRIYFLSFIIQ
ncbi:flagellar basal body-associated FliL family protein [Hippea maritima]|uniref:Flagellar protein FliL n=1 Tax=Hippea maritima (strain ATCC 700847 / DSM 10411 / MH2) TaxID=760142 RepID=F2LVQ4_HIPMA|nr:flagellar basal body-associated FliL family protein [Hippea maritima]AEA33838.1 flagellar basal body-associated protein FliL [Hippea maritima DSM 10411]